MSSWLSSVNAHRAYHSPGTEPGGGTGKSEQPADGARDDPGTRNRRSREVFTASGREKHAPPARCQHAQSDVAGLLGRRLPHTTVSLLRRLGTEARSMGVASYAVGGFVRDLFLGKPTVDIDIVVEGDASAFARRLARAMEGTYVAFHRFRTASVWTRDGSHIDVASARTERYARPGALPEVKPGSIELDLYRRDFTINSMAIRLDPGEFGSLLDPFGGWNDLTGGRLRVLHERSFLDDPTRILRAIRFEQRLGFHMVKGTRRLLHEHARRSVLRSVSPQRLRNELVLMAKEPSAARSLERLDEFGVLAAIYPGLSLDSTRRKILARVGPHLQWYHTLDSNHPVEDWGVYLQVLLVGLRATQRRRAAGCLVLHRRVVAVADQIAAKASRALRRLSRAPDLPASAIYFSLKPLYPETVIMLMSMTNDRRALARLTHYLSDLRDRVPAVTGKDLVGMGLAPGPAHGRVLRHLLSAQLNGVVSSAREQQALAAQLVRRELAS